MWCWGYQPTSNFNGNTVSTPAQVPNVSGAVSVAVGPLHACASFASGKVACWGGNPSGQLGNGTTNFSASPVFTAPVSHTGAGAVEISAEGGSTCARLSDGSVACWGQDDIGELGNGTMGASVPFPVPSSIASDVVSLTAAFNHACAILVNGLVFCWGDDNTGVLGDSGTNAQSVPVGPVPTIVNAIEIATGFGHSCAVIVDGTIRCWGDNSSGQHEHGALHLYRQRMERLAERVLDAVSAMASDESRKKYREFEEQVERRLNNGAKFVSRKRSPR